MFKRAYVRGIQNALVQSGQAVFSDEGTAAKIADYIADRIQLDPVSTRVPREVTAKIASELLVAALEMKKTANFKAASVTKIANLTELAKVAHAHAIDLMEKAAEGSNIEGGDKGNKEPSSAEAKMDAAERPEGYAASGLGNTAVDTRPGAVGKEQDQPAKPAESPSGSNSVIEQSRTASLAALLKKHAQGSNLHGGDKGNTEPTSAEAKMDAALRPEGYAVLPHQGALGAVMEQVRGPAVVGRETPHPQAPSEHPSGTNSLLEHSSKAAEDAAFMTLFKKTASEVGQYLPKTLNEEQKVAHVRRCMGLSTEDKAHYLIDLEKKAGELPEFLKKKMDGAAAKDGDDEKKDEKKEEKKEASLLDQLRRLGSTASQPNA